jgi:hypothetical protein
MAVGTVSGIEPDDNWQLITTTTISSGTAQYTYSSLSGYKKIMLAGKNIVKNAEDYSVIQLNGVTANGAYVSNSSNGSFFYIAASNASAGGIVAVIYDVDKSFIHKVESTGYSGVGAVAYYTDPVAVTSIKLYNRDGATFTSGTIYLYGIAA